MTAAADNTENRRTVITAEIVANVLTVPVTPGDRVGTDATLMVLESMKMEMPVTAPHDGVVTRVGADVGDVVHEGDLLIELAPESI